MTARLAAQPARTPSEQEIAEAIHKGRYADENNPRYRPLSDSGPIDQEYCHRLARHVLAVLARTTSPPEGEQAPWEPPIETCPKCGAQGAAFICSTPGCPVNGGAAYPAAPPAKTED